MKAAIQHIIFILLASVILLAAHYMPPFIEQNPPLQLIVPAGINLNTQTQALTLDHWLDRSYQNTQESFIRDEPYMRALGVRLKNQALFSLFNHNANPKTVVGPDGYLFDPTYIKAYLGHYNQSDSLFAHRLQQIRQLKARLDSVGTQLLILLPPPKAYVYPEWIPPSYQKLSQQPSDRRKMAEALRNEGIACMDFDFYRELKDNSPALFYPKTGLHWSHYGAFVGLDSLRGTLSRMLGRDLPQLQLDSLHFTDKPKAPDNELAVLTNLWGRYPYDSLAYPHYQVRVDSNAYRPKILTVGDSYYHLWSEFGYLDGLFAEASQEWFYYGRRFSQAFPKGKGMDKSPAVIQGAIEEADVLILEASATNLNRFGFGFLEQYLGSH
ncbi:MAG: hypothetical protein AAFN10_05850 [Bacteroidota bacterium]